MTLKEKLIFMFKGTTPGDSNSNVPKEPKQKKVREKKITRLQLILAGIVILTVLVVFIVINVKISNKNKAYQEYEKELVNAANLYYRKMDYKIKDGTSERISVKKLISTNFLNTDSKLVDKCDGYVESTSEKDYDSGKYIVTRKAYIKCGSKYKTVNYTSY